MGISFPLCSQHITNLISSIGSRKIRSIQQGCLNTSSSGTLPHTYLSCNLILPVAVKLSLKSYTSRVSGQQIKLPHLDILPPSTDLWWSSKKFFHSLTQALDSALLLLLKKKTAPERHRRIWGEINGSQLTWWKISSWYKTFFAIDLQK